MKPRSLKELLTSAQHYTIPLYQRNYAWTEVEVIQLLEDIKDKLADNDDYYIGTLTIDKSAGEYYIVDGQQRFTTITLINAVAQGKYAENKEITASNLRFDAREEIRQFIDGLFSNYDKTLLTVVADEGIENILAAIKTIEAYFHDWKQNDLKSYFSYFNQSVKIIELDVPEGTDINHYFEVMNNRGEQLEQHEILKAAFLSAFIDQPEAYHHFSNIWDACSQMDKPVQQSFRREEWDSLFGKDLLGIPREAFAFTAVAGGEPTTKGSGGATMAELLDRGEVDVPEEDKKQTDSKYKSIIDFPNFLLQVLSLQSINTSLDDKKLLLEFGYPNAMRDATKFINDLLYCRVLFDRYIIKRKEVNDDWGWRLIKPIKSGDKEKDNKIDFVGTFRNTSGSNEDIIMIQSMLHVAHPGNSNKRWLLEVLQYLKEEGEINDPDRYFWKLETIAREAIIAIVPGIKQNEHAKLHQGTGTPRLLFYYLDYLLWKQFKRDKEATIFQLLDKTAKTKFDKFRFTQHNSVEHVAPQNPDKGDFEPEEKLHHFGNLCLISSSANSRMINLSFKGKREYFLKAERAESLKQVLIFSHLDWTKDTIDEHYKNMIELITSDF